MEAQINATIKNYGAYFESFLNTVIVERIREQAVPELSEPMVYALQGGGKRIRPVIALVSAGGMLPDSPDYSLFTRAGFLEMDPRALAPLYAAASLESLHTYSLIHDDLPAMDDDDLRRGRASCHRAFNEWKAILAGDALNAFAFEILADADPGGALGLLLGELSLAGGMSGMISGQALDLQAEKQPESVASLDSSEREGILFHIHHKKTAAMIRASMTLGALAGGVRSTAPASIYGEKLGLLFQITDDILDVTSTTDDLGKTAGKDEKSGKLTYPGLFGLERSKEIARGLVEELQELAPGLVDDPAGSEQFVASFFYRLPGYIYDRKS